MKKTTYYFTHDYNAANDVKCLFMRQQLGMEGYGIFWYLIESLATAGGYLPLKIVPVLAMQMQVTETKVNGVIHNFDLFTVKDEGFFSNRLNDHLQLRQTLSEDGKKGAIARWGNRGAIGDTNGEAIAAPNEEGNAKEKKGNKKKGKQSKEIKTLSLAPFSEDFTSSWHEWLLYKKEQFKFVFASIDSEQKAFTALVNLSQSNEQRAKAIIDQSITSGWKGFYDLKNPVITQTEYTAPRKSKWVPTPDDNY